MRVCGHSPCRGCGRDTIGRFGEASPPRCPCCAAAEERQARYHGRQRLAEIIALFEAGATLQDVAVRFQMSQTRARQLIDESIPTERERRQRERQDKAERQRRVVAMLADPDGPSQSEIARRVGLSPERVRQIRKSAIKRGELAV